MKDAIHNSKKQYSVKEKNNIFADVAPTSTHVGHITSLVSFYAPMKFQVYRKLCFCYVIENQTLLMNNRNFHIHNTNK